MSVGMIPQFPTLRKLDIGDRQTIGKMISEFPPYSDFNFLSLWSYNTENDLQISLCRGNLVILMRDYISNEPIFTFIGVKFVKETVRDIFEELKKLSRSQLIKLVPEVTVLQIEDGHDFTVAEDRDNFDYVYSVNNLVELKGGEMHKIKNYVNRFKALYPHVKVKKMDLADMMAEVEIMSVFDEWKKNKGQDQEAEHERIAVVRTLKSAKELDNILAIGLFDADKLIGFMISDMGNNGYAQSHFSKACTSRYHGIFPFIYHSLAVQLSGMGYKYMNFEQDLGIPGLRRAKEQMKPVLYLKKYVITPRV